MKIGKTLRGSASVVAVLVLAACNQQQTQTNAPSGPADPAKLTSVATNDIGKTPDMQQMAMAIGKDVYDKNCGLCHGGDLKGSVEHNTPDLTDDYWMFTGDDLNSGGLVLFPSDVEKTVLYGVRSDHEKTRKDADMPGLGAQARNILNAQEIADVTEYVLKLSGQPANEQAVMRADKLWNDKGSCYDCHDPDGIGNSAVGGTDLTKKEHFLYGSDKQSITETIISGRHGISPAFEGKLTAEEIKAVSVYVFSFAKQPPPPPVAQP